MKILNTFLVALFCMTSLYQAHAQNEFDCGNMELVGIYTNNFNTDELSIVLTNSSVEHDGNGNVYTGFQIITTEGDTILKREPCFCYSLPNRNSETIVYNIEIFEEYGTIYDLPEDFCGEIIIEFPDCRIPFCKNEIMHPNLPEEADINCEDYKILGIYETAHGGITNYSMLLNFTNLNYKGMLTGYTSFEFVDNNGEPLTENTGPHFILPQYIQDTTIVHLQFYEQIDSTFCGTLRMTDPTCEIDYCQSVGLSTEIVEEHNINLFPNPTSGEVFLESQSAINAIIIYDLSGKIVFTTQQVHFDISHLAKGAYLIEAGLENNKKWQTTLVKIR